MTDSEGTYAPHAPQSSEAVASESAPLEKPARRIQSVERALTIFEILADSPDALALSEIADRAGLNVSTCHHLIATLVERGYVLNAGRNRGYMLSSRLHELTDMTSRKTSLADFARTSLIALSGKLGLSVQLAELEGTSLVTRFKANVAEVHVIEADEVIKMRAAHATATGKAIPWRPDNCPILVATDFGVIGRSIADIQDTGWPEFINQCEKAGCPLLILNLWAEERWPENLGSHPELIHWSPSTTASMIRQVIGVGHEMPI